MAQRCAIQGSEAIHLAGGDWLPAQPEQTITVTILIRKPARAGEVGQKLLSGSWPAMSRAEAENLLRVEPSDLAAVRAFAQKAGLTVLAENAEARTIQLEGSLAQTGRAFGVDLAWRIDPAGQKYLSYQGHLTVPQELSEIVEAVLGLDQRPIARRAPE